MANFIIQIYISYSQICVFLSSLAQPFNDWSDRNFTQGFAWRPGSASFKTLVNEGEHKINLFINEPFPLLSDDCIRAFRVPFETQDGDIEIASISDTNPFNVPSGKYALQIEFLKIKEGNHPEVNIRLNKGDSDFLILKADEEISREGDLNLLAQPAV